jgi:hypothetical protein
MVGVRLLVLLAGLLPAGAHPTHTSSAELVYQADSVRVALRVFADDMAGVGGIPRYVDHRFGIVDRSGARVALHWVEAETSGDVLTIRLQGALPGGMSGARVGNAILTERFDDQVNVVRAAYGGRAATLIFSRGDGPKALP